MTAQAGAVALNPCKCGSPAEVDWGGGGEIAGVQWTRVSVSCTNPSAIGCFREVSIEIDSDGDTGHVAEAAAIAAWNAAYSPTPPAAVPVEALETIAPRLRGLAGVIRKHGICAPLALDEIADELTQLIKERSNGR